MAVSCTRRWPNKKGLLGTILRKRYALNNPKLIHSEWRNISRTLADFQRLLIRSKSCFHLRYSRKSAFDLVKKLG